MDIQIDLRRGDFEGMHPKAKLFNFDAEKMVYFGDNSESINSQWTTWCACIGMLHLDGKEAQAVPEGFVLVSKDTLNKALNPNDYDEAVCSANELLAVIEAQEPAND
ncbi:hypothetical protein [Acinetobacter sp. YH01006]|uniref:hypothetical protein n=1 Tax=Acinetobacter sp. YH01006 TaxID=2601022 RepID=UPI00211E805B|nr:hypothetical protein [Acinetobacter sp. YH01006]